MAELHLFYATMNCGKSRIGLVQPAIVVDHDLDLYEHVGAVVLAGAAVDVLICDEAQFYSPRHIDQLGSIVDDLDIEVHAFGLLTDFTTSLFPGSQRLLELADRRHELQVEARCWCGERGVLNARTVDGAIQREGVQVMVGDVGPGEVAYEVLCRRHHREGTTRHVADRRHKRSGISR